MRRRNKLRVCVHFVWATKNRLPLITEGVERAIHRCASAICDKLGCPCLAVGGVEDHVHLLVALSATITLGQVMKEVKGGTSRMVSEEIISGDWFAWQPNYAAISVSPSHVVKVTRYICRQREHHAAGTLWPEAEETDEVMVDDDP